jgi:hypothetical protein
MGTQMQNITNWNMSLRVAFQKLQQHFNNFIPLYYYGTWCWISEVTLFEVLEQQISISYTFHFVVHCVFYQIMNVSEKIFHCNIFNEKRHSHVWKNVLPIQLWMINILVVSTVKQRGKICVKYRITFYEMIKTVTYVTIQDRTSVNYKKLNKENTQRYWVFGLCLSSGWWTKSEKPISLCVIHHRQNPIVSKENTIYPMKQTLLVLQMLVLK